jgi:hypothetical protein
MSPTLKVPIPTWATCLRPVKKWCWPLVKIMCGVAATASGSQVQLTNHIVLNPYAAKRLAAVLDRVVAEYESKFGTL